MKPRTLLRHAKEGIKNLGRNGWMTFASISSVAVALILVGFFSALMMNLNYISNQVEGDVKVKAYLNMTISDQQIDKVESQIKEIPEVGSVDFIPKDEGWQKFLESMSQGPGDASVFKTIDNNPLPNAFSIMPKEADDSAEIAQAVKKIEGVSSVNYGKKVVDKLLTVTQIARNVGLVLIIGLIFMSVFLIGNTIKLTIVSRKTEIEIMKLVGATNGFIRWPFFTEGLLLGVLGSALPIAVLLFGYNSLYELFNQNYSLAFVNLLPMQPTIYYLAGGLLAIGAFIGVWGSVTSVRKFLKV